MLNLSNSVPKTGCANAEARAATIEIVPTRERLSPNLSITMGYSGLRNPM
jgi:hypothetical protein